MRVGVLDIDDVLAEFNLSLQEFYNRRNRTTFSVEDIFSFNLWEVWDCTRKESTDVVDAFYNSLEFENLLQVDGAQKGVRQLANSYDELIALSSRPEKLREITERWIKRNFGDDIKRIYLTNQWVSGATGMTKGSVCRDTGASFIVEDAMHYVQECVGENPNLRAILLNKPWNRSATLPERTVRVYSWDQIPRELAA